MVRKATIQPGEPAKLRANAAAYARASSDARVSRDAQWHAENASTRAIVLVGTKGEHDAPRDRAGQDWGEARASRCVRGQHTS